MTPYQFVKAECCNLMDSTCVRRDDRLICLMRRRTKPAHSTKPCKCLLAMSRSCSYYERVICKIADQPSPKADPGLQKRRQKAVAAYRSLHDMDQGGRTCPDCGAPVAKRQRYCESCTKKRRRQTYRSSRKTKDTRATVKPILPVVSHCKQRSQIHVSSKVGALGLKRRNGQLTVAHRAGIERT